VRELDFPPVESLRGGEYTPQSAVLEANFAPGSVCRSVDEGTLLKQVK
jgi:hypothetical protein